MPTPIRFPRLALLLALAALVAFHAAVTPTLAQDIDATDEPPIGNVLIPDDATAPDAEPPLIGNVEPGGNVNVTIGDDAPDVPSAPTAPRPIIDSGSILLLVFGLTGSILAGGGGLMILSRFLKRKDVQDLTEATYQRQPDVTQQGIQTVIGLLEKATVVMMNALEFAKRVTDGKPNDEPPTVPPLS